MIQFKLIKQFNLEYALKTLKITRNVQTDNLPIYDEN